VAKGPFPALTLNEIASIAADLQPLVGAQLQECMQTTSELGLAFYHAGQTTWLWFDLNPLRPLVVRLPGTKPPARKKISRPLTLFLRSRFLGRRLTTVRADVARGRLLVFNFHRSENEDAIEELELEVRLFPHGQNIIARDEEKSIAELKPKDMPTSQAPVETEAPRTWPEIEEQWRELQTTRVKGVAASAQDSVGIEREWQRQVEKKEKALERMREELEKKLSTPLALLGEWLKTHRTLKLTDDTPPEWRELLNEKKSLAWNIENSFHRAKENARKASGSRLRIVTVEAELAKLKAAGPGKIKPAHEQKQGGKENLLARADATGRRFALAADLDVYIGKSAADNLALLRRAQPFDYWLHLREQPGSHAIMRRTRTRNVTDAEFKQAGIWVIEQSVKKRASELKGERFDLLIVECRYVRPIKGDKIGRVNYSNDRVMTIRF
jgi:predicted ribosome quality control (RQC) complex YloA/Tae2 family protein